MASSSENLPSLPPPHLADSWLDLISPENDSFITRALQKSLAAHEIGVPKSPPLPSPQSEVTADPRRQPLKVSSKGSKRKSRASKRSLTTFIAADPANFRQMVQQVTGGNVQLALPPAAILKPAPQRPGAAGGGLLPTLDTSEFLLGLGSSLGPVMGQSPLGVAVGDGGLEFQAFPCFPTLESWKVM